MHSSWASVADEQSCEHMLASLWQLVATVWHRLMQFVAGPLPPDEPELDVDDELVDDPAELVLDELHATAPPTTSANGTTPTTQTSARPFMLYEDLRSRCLGSSVGPLAGACVVG
jgi:hypothetical protein